MDAKELKEFLEKQDGELKTLLTRGESQLKVHDARHRWEWKDKSGTVHTGRLKDFFGGMRAVDVTTPLLKKYIHKYRAEKKLSNATINRDLAALRRAF